MVLCEASRSFLGTKACPQVHQRRHPASMMLLGSVPPRSCSPDDSRRTSRRRASRRPPKQPLVDQPKTAQQLAGDATPDPGWTAIHEDGRVFQASATAHNSV